MQIDFHYYAAYCAAILADYTPEESLAICTASQYVDCCTKTSLKKMKAPLSAATTQTQMEMMDTHPGILSVQDITRIWASFHFLPGNLYAQKSGCSRQYLSKYRLICQPNSPLLQKTLEQAKKIGTPQAMGIALHVLADTWAHRNFAGTPSMVINNITPNFYEERMVDGKPEWKKVEFRHKVGTPDDLEAGKYTNTLIQFNEWSVMNLGHGRVGHLPDYSFIKYKYLPAWGDYKEVIKDNPAEYLSAFAQMVYALKWFREDGNEAFQLNTYAWDTVAPVRDEIDAILRKRQLLGCAEWKALGERLSGQPIPDFSESAYEQEYLSAPASEKDKTAPGQFIHAALAQKSMVSRSIFQSRNLAAGVFLDRSRFKKKGGEPQ